MLAALLSVTSVTEASNRKILAGPTALRAARSAIPPSPLPVVPAPVSVVSSAAPGQEGYVHFFLLRDPEGWDETQVAIELKDQRIAWSFPEIGVSTAPFIKSGSVDVNGRRYEYRHLYGVRPFGDERSMRELREKLEWRIAPYIDDRTPYCYLRSRGEEFCLSCLDFVVRVLYPGHFPLQPVLPNNFHRMGATLGHTTEDLLLYLLGLQGQHTHAARLQRIRELALPDDLREDVLQLVESIEVETPAEGAKEAPPARKTATKRRTVQPSGTGSPQPGTRRRKS